MVKNLPANVGDAAEMGLIPGSGRSPGVGNGRPLQCSCLENSIDSGAWQATVHGVSQSCTQLSTAQQHHKTCGGCKNVPLRSAWGGSICCPLALPPRCVKALLLSVCSLPMVDHEGSTNAGSFLRNVGLLSWVILAWGLPTGLAELSLNYTAVQDLFDLILFPFLPLPLWLD